MRSWICLFLAMSALVPAANRILVHGHRGARAVLPENTIPAFQHALKAGADYLELDLAVTKDNVLIVSHDPQVNTAICTGPHGNAPIRTLTLAQVREYDCGAKPNPGFAKQQAVPGTRMPTFDEVLDLGKGNNVRFNVEIKMSPRNPDLFTTPEHFAELTLAAIKKHKMEKRVIVQSFDFRPLVVMHRIAPHIQLSALLEPSTKLSFAEAAKETGAAYVSPHYSLVTPEKVAAAHQAGLQIVPWTANDPAVWDKLIAAKVDAIITDDPAALVAYLKK